MYRDPTYARTGALFTGHSTGAYTLPDELVDAERRARALLERLRRPGRDRQSDPTREQYLADLYAAIDAGEELPDPIVLRQASEHDRALDELHTLLVGEVELAEMRVVATTQRHAETILVRHLRPALEETVDATRKAATTLGGVLPSHDAIVSGPEAHRKAWLALEALSARYRAIRAAQQIVADVTEGPRYQSPAMLHSFRNLQAIWPNYSNPQASKPWPTTDRGFMMWLATSGIEPWLPTPAEQDELFARSFPNAPILRGRRAGVPIERAEVVGA